MINTSRNLINGPSNYEFSCEGKYFKGWLRMSFKVTWNLMTIERIFPEFYHEIFSVDSFSRSLWGKLGWFLERIQRGVLSRCNWWFMSISRRKFVRRLLSGYMRMYSGRILKRIQSRSNRGIGRSFEKEFVVISERRSKRTAIPRWWRTRWMDIQIWRWPEEFTSCNNASIYFWGII